jgi:Helix-turn-helix
MRIRKRNDMETILNKHWTDTSLKDFSYWILSDFTSQIETRMEEKEISNSAFAATIHVSPSRVSQVLNDPGNLTIGNVVKYARGLQMKVSLIMYDDHDPDNKKGPIHAEVFKQCWERMGCPQEVSDLQNITQARGCWVLTKNLDAVNDRSKISCMKVEKTAGSDNYGVGRRDRGQSA